MASTPLTSCIATGGHASGSSSSEPALRSAVNASTPSSTLCPPRTSSRDVTCQGYVGQGARPAGQYFECDFDWDEHARAVRPLVEAQEAKALALRLQSLWSRQADGDAAGRGQATAGQGLHKEPRLHQQQGAEASSDDGESCCVSSLGATASVAMMPASAASATAAAAAPPPPLRSHAQDTSAATDGCRYSSLSDVRGARSETHRPAPWDPSAQLQKDHSLATANGSAHSLHKDVCGSSCSTTPTPTPSTSTATSGATSLQHGAYEGSRWEHFYRSHPSARFFKERRYLLLEFPELLSCRHVAEIGCGCGSSILPVLKANAAAWTTCTDISTTCLQQLRDAAVAEGIDSARISVFPADAADPAAAPAFDGINADALLIMFTLSAVTPPQQLVMLSHAWRALRPGGRLMIRDHGLYDMVQLRIPAEQWVGPNLYERGDGTMAYFFSTEELQLQAACAGFDTVECKYVTVINRNRKTGVELRRVFVHGVFEKPVADGR